jgi:hypothetical protein
MGSRKEEEGNKGTILIMENNDNIGKSKTS